MLMIIDPVHDAAGEVPAARHREGHAPAGGPDAPAVRRDHQLAAPGQVR